MSVTRRAPAKGARASRRVTLPESGSRDSHAKQSGVRKPAYLPPPWTVALARDLGRVWRAWRGSPRALTRGVLENLVEKRAAAPRFLRAPVELLSKTGEPNTPPPTPPVVELPHQQPSLARGMLHTTQNLPTHGPIKWGGVRSCASGSGSGEPVDNSAVGWAIDGALSLPERAGLRVSHGSNPSS
jgi:hypothetical protein